MFGRLLPLLVAGTTLAMSSMAFAYSDTVKGACRADYKRFCAAHAINDPGLRRCMDRAGQSLSRSCVVALINSGQVSKTRASQRWGHVF